jgi:prevent-host-death family protein
MYHISLEEAKQCLSTLVEQAMAGEDVVITQDNKPVARLVAAVESAAKAEFGSAKGAIIIAEDFHEPLDDFKEYT